ncbi:MAG: rRNA maturation RNase YbeY, partial [Firmicutes bacterium]|nr:rRNA maturation RNase YbeY [Bacillota bacterium]
TAARPIHDLEKGLTAEVERLVVHGTLHLLGYNHETAEDALRMREQEETIMNILLMS